MRQPNMHDKQPPPSPRDRAHTRAGQRAAGPAPGRSAVAPVARRWVSAAAAVLLAALVAGCGGAGSPSGATRLRQQRRALSDYLREVEPPRLAVNKLLEGADPILSAYARGDVSAARAAQRMGALERRFAGYAVQVAAIEPETPRLRALQQAYAHTYILEDSYLSALTNGLATRNLDSLPDTQSAQRAAIIEWRIGLTVLARRVSLALPADLQRAGRGEIAPAPGGS
jgi:hypothetical protein